MKLVRKLILSTVSLAFVGVTFATTTYAWIKIYSRAEVTNFDFRATGGLGFLISHDGVNFQNDITTSQMESAIILGYDGGQQYEYDDKGNLVYKSSKAMVTDDEKAKLLNNNILLMPVTSKYGYSFQGQSGDELVSGAGSGKYIEFDLYFKTTSELVDDYQAYDISLYTAKNYKTDEQGKNIYPTSISSDIDQVTLRKAMKYMNLSTDEQGNEAWENKELSKDEMVTVASMNALRFSTEVIKYKDVPALDDNDKEYYQDANGNYFYANDEGNYLIDGVSKTQAEMDLDENYQLVTDSVLDDSEDVRKNNSHIYEFYDDNDHGSYAVKGAESGSMYNPEYNAMLTYYNNQKSTKIYPIEEEDLPSTTRYKSGTDKIMPTIMTLESGPSITKVTFRFWLEGWDADCFDGLTKSINVNLTFTSTKKKIDG